MNFNQTPPTIKAPELLVGRQEIYANIKQQSSLSSNTPCNELVKKLSSKQLIISQYETKNFAQRNVINSRLFLRAVSSAGHACRQSVS